MRMQTQSFLRGNHTSGKGLNAEAFPLFVLVTAAFLALRTQCSQRNESSRPGPNPGPVTSYVTLGKVTWPL